MTSSSVLLALTNVLFANECDASCARLDTVLKHLQHDREDMEDSFILQVSFFLSQSLSSHRVSFLPPALPHAHTRTHTSTHARTHTHTHTQTYKRTNTHSPPRPPTPSLSLSLLLSRTRTLFVCSHSVASTFMPDVQIYIYRYTHIHTKCAFMSARMDVCVYTNV